MDELANYQDENKAIKALIVFTKILKGRRLITFGGVFADIKKQLKLNDVETGDLVNIEDEQKENFQEVKKVLFKFNVKVGCYILSNIKIRSLWERIFSKNYDFGKAEIIVLKPPKYITHHCNLSISAHANKIKALRCITKLLTKLIIYPPT